MIYTEIIKLLLPFDYFVLFLATPNEQCIDDAKLGKKVKLEIDVYNTCICGLR